MIDHERNVHRLLHLDTNRINARGGLVDVNQLESWHERRVIILEMAAVAVREASAGGLSARARKARGYVQTFTLAHTEPERQALRAIELAIFPDGAESANDRNDVEIAFNAKKYCAILVTADGSLLRARERLAPLGVTVMSASEAVAHVQSLIEQRDTLAVERCRRTGAVVPTWVGRD